ncbi:hypothetical protein ABH926_000100 [Catenulispora sp. GP43]|uniref:DUF4132 domain-containing protein n=1 Tax=Catenulispora sp. GP43 TaxID=3156263 RepID=UPI0035167F5E
MGWFRGRRKRRGAGADEVGDTTAQGADAHQAADARQASAAGGPDSVAGAVGQERDAQEWDIQEPDIPAPAQDRIPWRHLEAGAYERLLGSLADDADVSALLDYCERSSQWDEAAACRLVDRAPHAGLALSRLVDKEGPARPESTEFISGLIKALPLLRAEDAVPLLVRLAAQQSRLTTGSMPTARAAIRALAAVDGELVPPALHRLAAEARLAALRKAAYAELKRRLRTLANAPEWTVSTYGLDAAGRVRVAVGPGHVAVVRLQTGGQVTVRYHERSGPEAAEGRPLTGRPTAATVEQDTLREVSELAAELRTAVRAARTRLASAQKERREIPLEDWLEHYITHPVTGSLGRTLLWEVRSKAAAGESGTYTGAGTGWRMGLPKKSGRRWALATETTELIVPGDDDVLRIAVPGRLPPAQLRAWTRVLAKAGAESALKQLKPR